MRSKFATILACAAVGAVMATSSTDSVAVYDGSTASSIYANIVAELAPPARAVVDFATLYQIGVLTWNKSAAEDAEKAILARDLLYSKDLANTGSGTTRWIGFGLDADGTSQWVFPVNQTGYEPYPKIYNGNVTTGSMYEESVHGSDAMHAVCNGTAFCLRDFWMNGYGEPILPAIGHYAPYDPRTRPWYMKLENITRGAQTRRWTAGFTTWLHDVVITADAALFDSPNADTRNFVGVFSSGVSTADIGGKLKALSSTGTVTFVMDKETGILQFSSIPGACGQLDTSSTHGTWIAYLAENSTSDLIASSAAFLSRSIPDVNPVLWEGYWVTVHEITEIGGLALENPWLVVVLQLACPSSGTFFKRTARSGSMTASDATQANTLGDCAPCPFGMNCMGGLALPFPRDGFWTDISSVDALSIDAMECLAPENCLGARVPSCFSTLGNYTDCLASEGFEDSICTENSESRLCDVCVEDFYYEENVGCLECGSPEVVWAFLWPLLFMLAAAAGLVAIRCYSPSWWIVLTNPARLKIFLATAQIVGTISWATGVSWPEPFRGLSNALSSVLSLNLFTLLPASCWGIELSFLSQVLFATLWPIAVVIVIQLLSTICFPEKRGSAIYWSQLIFFCVLPSTSLTLFRVFDCLYFEDGSSWLVAELTKSCDSAYYGGLVAYTLIFILVYPLGIPLGFFFVLYRKRHDIQALDRSKSVPRKLRKYEFLFVDYSSDHWYGETLRSFMRVTLSGFVVMFNRSSVVRSFWGLVLAFIFLEVMREHQLFLQITNNAIAIFAQYQIFFTYFMAFLITADPFNSNNEAISWLLIVANLAVFVRAGMRGIREARSRQTILELTDQTLGLAKELEEFQKSMPNVVAVSRSFERGVRKYLPSKEQVDEAVKVMGLDQRGLEEKDDEKAIFVEMTIRSQKKGETALWYWAEDAKNIDSHKPSEVLTDSGSWVKYADSVGAQLEKCYQDKGDGNVNVDVEGRVTSTKTLGKLANAQSGTKYHIDLKRMVQINATTKYERKVRRVVVSTTDLTVTTFGNATTGWNASVLLGGSGATAGPDWLSAVEAILSDPNEGADYEEIPSFPVDLVDKTTGEPKEQLLCAHIGQLIQVQQKRDDGWLYGYVIFDPNTDGQDGTSTKTLVSKLRGLDQARKQAKDDVADQAHVNSSASLFGMASQANKYKAAKDEDEDEDDMVGFTSGWFPSAYTRMPTPLELADMQASLYPLDAVPAVIHINPLAPPDNWDTKDNPDPLHPRRVNLPVGDQERVDVENFFLSSFGNTLGKGPTIQSVQRIEAIALWQSFVAKSRQLKMRAKAEGHADAYADAYEKKWMFHGTSPDVVPKIVYQGFNRSFCGRNAVRYGKGVYFATTSRYSNQFSHPDQNNVKQMFLCRVAVGEYCLGKDGQNAPDERHTLNIHRHILYDSTTDNMDDNRRHMFVVYHDAQAYPEYLIEYSE